MSARFPDFWVAHKEGVCLRLDARDHLFPRPVPPRAGVSHMRDMLMRALGVRFGDTGYLNVGHSRPLSRMRTKLCLSPYAERGGPLG
jgi:hypothetical protein